MVSTWRVMKQERVIFVIAFFSSFSFLFARNSYPPLIPQIIEEFTLSYVEASLPMSIVTLSGVFLSLLTWVLIFKWGVKKIGFLSLVICSVGSGITVLSNSFTWLVFGRFLLGFGGTFVAIINFSILPQWFSEKDLGRVMGIKGLDMPLATIISLNLLPLITASYSWRISLLLSMVSLIISTLLFLLFMKDKNTQQIRMTLFDGLWNRQMWLLGVTWCFFTMDHNIMMPFFLAVFISFTEFFVRESSEIEIQY